jgi:hypothetical protein
MLFVIEIASAVIAVAFVFVEIVLPLWKGTKLFPSFRRREIEATITDQREAIERARLERQADELKARADRIRSRRLRAVEKSEVEKIGE